MPSAEIDRCTVIATGTWLKIATVQDEDLFEGELFSDAASFIQRVAESRLNADIFTFAQKLPDTEVRHPFHVEWDNLAVIPITTYSEWWDKRVDPGVRRAVRKAAKAGVAVRVAEFDDTFVEGIVQINNEMPIRQGKPFWHYNKPFEAVKEENSTYPDRNIFLGAYNEDGVLIGFIRLTCVDKVANVIQLLSMVQHYDKRPANALIAKAVEVCEAMGLSHLVYCNYVYNDPNSSLTEFKRRNGFEKVLVPRYHVGLTPKGRLAVSLGLHRGVAQCIPQPILTRLLRLRSMWFERRFKAIEETA